MAHLTAHTLGGIYDEILAVTTDNDDVHTISVELDNGEFRVTVQATDMDTMENRQYVGTADHSGVSPLILTDEDTRNCATCGKDR